MNGTDVRGASHRVPDWRAIEQQVLAPFGRRADTSREVVAPEHVRAYLRRGAERFDLVCRRVRAHVQDGASVLEVGCAYGAIALGLRELGYDVRAADLPASLGRYGMPLEEAGVPLSSFDLYAPTPVAGEPFEAVVASEVLEHLQMGLGEAVRRLASLLAPGGTLVLTTPNLYRMGQIARILRGVNIITPFPDEPVLHDGQAIDTREHPREPTMRDLVDACRDAGLDIIERRVFNSGPTRTPVRLAYAVAPRRWREYLLLVARAPGETRSSP